MTKSKKKSPAKGAEKTGKLGATKRALKDLTPADKEREVKGGLGGNIGPKPKGPPPSG